MNNTQTPQHRDRLFFRDTIPMPSFIYALIVLGAVITCYIVNMITLWYIAVGVAFIVGLFATGIGFLIMGMRTTVTDRGVHIEMGIINNTYPLDTIKNIALDHYKFTKYPFGQGTVRSGLTGKAFVADIRLKQGVRLDLRNGKHILVTTNHPQKMAEGIKHAILTNSNTHTDDIGPLKSEISFDFELSQRPEHNVQTSSSSS